MLVLGLGRPGTFQLPQHEVLIRNMVWLGRAAAQGEDDRDRVDRRRRREPGASRPLSGSVARSLDAAVGESELTGQLELIRIVESDLGRARTTLEVLTRSWSA